MQVEKRKNRLCIKEYAFFCKKITFSMNESVYARVIFIVKNIRKTDAFLNM